MHPVFRDRAARRCLLAAAAVAAFGAVYESFGHGVRSPFMHFAFLIPLCGAALIRLAWPAERSPSDGRTLCACALAALTAGSLFRGVLEIYGTTSALERVYGIAGGALLAAALIARLRAAKRSRERGSG